MKALTGYHFIKFCRLYNYATYKKFWSLINVYRNNIALQTFASKIFCLFYFCLYVIGCTYLYTNAKENQLFNFPQSWHPPKMFNSEICESMIADNCHSIPLAPSHYLSSCVYIHSLKFQSNVKVLLILLKVLTQFYGVPSTACVSARPQSKIGHPYKTSVVFDL